MNMTAGKGGINVNVAELNIENLGWFRDVLVYAKERNALDIIVVEKRPVRLGILKKCEIMEIGEGIVVKARQDRDPCRHRQKPARGNSTKKRTPMLARPS